ncbi:MAG: hypothetical protein JXA61_09055 [Bacteroidales bacterium]|nr:hypothetical protein [Bacteroidales bacterium]
MKNSLIIKGLLITCLFGSCSPQEYLPKTGDIDRNQYGSYIMVRRVSGRTVRGELIEAGRNRLIVLTDSNSMKKAMQVPLPLIKNYKIRYAQPKRAYNWAIPVFSLVFTLFPVWNKVEETLMPFHGYYFTYSIPFNLIATIYAAASNVNTVQYNTRSMPYDELKKFARFPQGIPPGVDLESIQ